MKRLLTLGLLALFTLLPWLNHGADLSLPITQSADLAAVDPGNGEGAHFIYRVEVQNASTPPEQYYRVHLTLTTTSFGRPLRASATQILFARGQPVGPDNQDFRTSGGGNWLTFQFFDESRAFPGAVWNYFDVAANAPDAFNRSIRGMTELFVGFRFLGESEQHYGWMQFTRPDTHFLSFFELSAWDWNPLPGEPIAAGEPPPIPLARSSPRRVCGSPGPHRSGTGFWKAASRSAPTPCGRPCPKPTARK